MGKGNLLQRAWHETIMPLGFWLFLIMGVILATCYYENTKYIENQNKKYEKISIEFSDTKNYLDKTVKRADSVSSVLDKMHNYMPMVSILQYRDSVCGKLPYKSGDVVMMKPDSSRWVIISTIIKGGKWQHTINYTVRDCSGKQMEVEPETLY